MLQPLFGHPQAF